MRTDFEIVIVGAGPAGAATACRLAQRGCRVLLLERTHFDSFRVGESLAPAVQPLLADLGVWQQFLALPALPSYGTRSIWGEVTPQVHSHATTPWGCGWHVDRVAFDRMLAGAAREAGALLLCGATVVHCEASTSRWRLEILEHGSRSSDAACTSVLHARVVIDATGRGARLAARLGAERCLLDRLVGVTTQFDGIDSAYEGYVLVETTADGWWYSAPVPGNRLVAMLMTDSDFSRGQKFGTLPAWRRGLHAATGTSGRVQAGLPAWGPRVVPAFSQRLRRRDLEAPWLAVGDAALSVDPISGSGVVRALRTAQACAETAISVLERPPVEAIAAYESDRDLECTQYLHERAFYYGVERRWSDSPFWKRRSGVAHHIVL